MDGQMDGWTDDQTDAGEMGEGGVQGGQFW